MSDLLEPALTALRAGGVVAYPTEAVYGLGCDPHDARACERLFALKQRPRTQGVLLIGADLDQVLAYVDLAAVPAASLQRVRTTWPGPYTWVFPAGPAAPGWIRGDHTGIAVRVTAHPIAAELCRRFGAALVSTSANRHGAAPARSADEVHAAFGAELDAVVDGPLGGLGQPTEIRDVLSGAVLRG